MNKKIKDSIVKEKNILDLSNDCISIVEEALRKKESLNYNEQLERICFEIINVCYQIEVSILKEGIVPEELDVKLETLKSMSSLCKIALCLPGFDSIDLPDDFVEDYKIMLCKVQESSEKIETEIKNCLNKDDFTKIKEPLEKNLTSLKMLYSHYIRVLEMKNSLTTI